MTATDIDVLVVGAGHAGLGVSARLIARDHSPLIIAADTRVGDTWRRRWDSLRLFTPRFVNGLPGMRFPDGNDPFPGKDEVADYQERYADWQRVPLRLGARVARLRPIGDIFEATIAGEALRARSVVIATGAHQTPRLPPFASRLDQSVLQLHSSQYGRIGPLPDGPVLVVGARNAGAEIAVELARTHDTTLSIGTQPPLAPRRWRSTRAWRVAQVRSWILRGRLLPKWLPWPIGVPYNVEVDIQRAAREGRIALRPRAVDASGEEVRFADGRAERFRTVVWATGFRLDDSWIDVPSGENGIAVGPHRRGSVPGLWIVRANLLASLHWGALDAVSDLDRSRR